MNCIYRIAGHILPAPKRVCPEQHGAAQTIPPSAESRKPDEYWTVRTSLRSAQPGPGLTCTGTALSAPPNRIRDFAHQIGMGGTICVELRLLGCEMVLDVGLIELDAEAVGSGCWDAALQHCRQEQIANDR